MSAWCGVTAYPGHVCDRRPGHLSGHRCDHLGWEVTSLREAMERPEPPAGPCALEPTTHPTEAIRAKKESA